MTDNEQPLIAPEEEASDDEFRAAIDAALAGSLMMSWHPVLGP